MTTDAPKRRKVRDLTLIEREALDGASERHRAAQTIVMQAEAQLQQAQQQAALVEDRYRETFKQLRLDPAKRYEWQNPTEPGEKVDPTLYVLVEPRKPNRRQRRAAARQSGNGK